MEPTEKTQHFERPTSHAQEFPVVKRIIYLVVIVAIGMITGAAGFLIANSQLPLTQYAIYSTGATVDQAQLPASPRSVRDATAIARAQTVGIIKQRVRTTDPYDQLVDPAEYIGSGVIATSDGWIMTAVPAAQLIKVAVTMHGAIYPAEKVSTDALTGISFLRIDAGSLAPITMGTSVDVGDALVSFGANSGVAPHSALARVLQRNYIPLHSKLDYIRSSDSLGEYILLDGALDQNSPQAYFGSDGTFAGFAAVKTNELLLIPPAVARLALEQGLRQQTAKDLGIYYIVNTPVTADDPSESITVFHPSHAPVRTGSLAAKAGLRKGDTIRSVAGEQITQDASVDYLWNKPQQDSSGVQLVIVRDGVTGPLQVSW